MYSLYPYDMRPLCRDLYEIVTAQWEDGIALWEVHKVYFVLLEWRIQYLFFEGTRTETMYGSTKKEPKASSSPHRARSSWGKAWKA